MRKVLIAYLVFSFQIAFAGDGISLLDSCEEAKNLWAGKPGDKVKGMYCTGLINGIVSTMIITANSSDKKTAHEFGICNPTKKGHFIPTEQAILVVHKFLDSHLNRLQEQDFVLAITALRDSFPCPAN